jgi:histone deacetylase 6
LNIPLNHGGNEIQAPGDNEYIYVYKRLIHPIINEFNPEFIIISAGYDACRNDPIGGFTVTPNAYYYMTRQLCEIGVPVLAVL